MRPDDRGINVVNLPVEAAFGVGLGLHGLEDPVPEASGAPAVEPARYRAMLAVVFGQVAPGGPGAQDPEDAVDDFAMVFIGPPGVGLLRWKQRLKPLPVLIGEVASGHGRALLVEKRRILPKPK